MITIGNIILEEVEDIDSLLAGLDSIATIHNKAQCGLPVYDEHVKKLMREVVLMWLISAVDQTHILKNSILTEKE